MMEALAIRMNRIPAYGPEHAMIVAVLAFAALAAAGVVHKFRIPVKYSIPVCGCILIALEILKEPLLTYVRGGLYSWSDFPFQLCSTPMYLSIIYIFIKRIRGPIENFLLVYGFLGAVASFAIPYSSFYSYLLLTMQSLLWHTILLFLSVSIFLEKREHRQWGSFRSAMVIYLILAAIAIMFNIMFYDISAGTCNMFFFGPGFPDVTGLNEIEETCGWVTEVIVMILLSEGGGLLLFRIMKKIGERKTCR